MRRRLFATLIVTAMALTFTAGPVAGQSRVLTTTLTSTATGVTATGTARLVLVPEGGVVCFFFTYSVTSGTLGTITQAHVHVDATGAVFLFPPSLPLNGCATGVDPALIEAVLTNPTAYYVNLHTNLFPGGALKGEL